VEWLEVCGSGSACDSRREDGPVENYCSCSKSLGSGAYHSLELGVLNSEIEIHSGGLDASTLASRWSRTARRPELGVHLGCYQCELPKLPQ
jgi:hypothetical protein